MTSPPSFDPDEALAEMGEFLTGHRTLQGYARFADTVRALHNHISAGRPLPRRWSNVQTVTIELYAPGALTGTHEVGIAQEFRTAIDTRSNWMVVKPASVWEGDDEPHKTGLTAVSQRALKYAIDDDSDMLPIEVEWLDSGHLRRLAEGAERLAAAARKALDERPPR